MMTIPRQLHSDTSSQDEDASAFSSYSRSRDLVGLLPMGRKHPLSAVRGVADRAKRPAGCREAVYGADN